MNQLVSNYTLFENCALIWIDTFPSLKQREIDSLSDIIKPNVLFQVLRQIQPQIVQDIDENQESFPLFLLNQMREWLQNYAQCQQFSKKHPIHQLVLQFPKKPQTGGGEAQIIQTLFLIAAKGSQQQENIEQIMQIEDKFQEKIMRILQPLVTSDNGSANSPPQSFEELSLQDISPSPKKQRANKKYQDLIKEMKNENKELIAQIQGKKSQNTLLVGRVKTFQNQNKSLKDKLQQLTQIVTENQKSSKIQSQGLKERYQQSLGNTMTLEEEVQAKNAIILELEQMIKTMKQTHSFQIKGLKDEIQILQQDVLKSKCQNSKLSVYKEQLRTQGEQNASLRKQNLQLRQSRIHQATQSQQNNNDKSERAHLIQSQKQLKLKVKQLQNQLQVKSVQLRRIDYQNQHLKQKNKQNYDKIQILVSQQKRLSPRNKGAFSGFNSIMSSNQGSPRDSIISNQQNFDKSQNYLLSPGQQFQPYSVMRPESQMSVRTVTSNIGSVQYSQAGGGGNNIQLINNPSINNITTSYNNNNSLRGNFQQQHAICESETEDDEDDYDGKTNQSKIQLQDISIEKQRNNSGNYNTLSFTNQSGVKSPDFKVCDVSDSVLNSSKLEEKFMLEFSNNNNNNNTHGDDGNRSDNSPVFSKQQVARECSQFKESEDLINRKFNAQNKSQRNSCIRLIATMPPEANAEESEVDSEIFQGGFIGDNQGDQETEEQGIITSSNYLKRGKITSKKNHLQIIQLERKLDEITKDKQKIKQRANFCQKKIQQLESENSQLRAKLGGAVGEITNTQDIFLKKAEKKSNQKDIQIKRLMQERDSAIQKLVLWEKKVHLCDQLKRKNKKLSCEKQSRMKQVQKLYVDKSDLQDKFITSKENVLKLQSEIRNIQEQLSFKQQKIANLQDQVSSKSSSGQLNISSSLSLTKSFNRYDTDPPIEQFEQGKIENAYHSERNTTFGTPRPMKLDYSPEIVERPSKVKKQDIKLSEQTQQKIFGGLPRRTLSISTATTGDQDDQKMMKPMATPRTSMQVDKMLFQQIQLLKSQLHQKEQQNENLKREVKQLEEEYKNRVETLKKFHQQEILHLKNVLKQKDKQMQIYKLYAKPSSTKNEKTESAPTSQTASFIGSPDSPAKFMMNCQQPYTTEYFSTPGQDSQNINSDHYITMFYNLQEQRQKLKQLRAQKQTSNNMMVNLNLQDFSPYSVQSLHNSFTKNWNHQMKKTTSSCNSANSSNSKTSNSHTRSMMGPSFSGLPSGRAASGYLISKGSVQKEYPLHSARSSGIFFPQQQQPMLFKSVESYGSESEDGNNNNKHFQQN